MFLTVLTPTYNRKHTLHRLYESLEAQTSREFCWLIVDDGSSDGTHNYVEEIRLKATIEIKYISKTNGGKHTAINAGMKVVDTPLTFVVDSDDYLLPDAVGIIRSLWLKYSSRSDIGSFWFLQSDPNGRVVGDRFPQDEFVDTYVSVMVNRKCRGDKRAVYLTKARKEFPFPVFDGEKFIGESTVHKRIGNVYKIVFVNTIIYRCDYLPDGLSAAGRKMRLMNPLGGMVNAKEFLTHDVNLKVRMKKMTLLIVYGLASRQKLVAIVRDSGDIVLALFCVPIALLLYLNWSRT